MFGRISVSSKLKQYCPLTIWEKVIRITKQFSPYIVAVAVGVTFSYWWAMTSLSMYFDSDFLRWLKVTVLFAASATLLSKVLFACERERLAVVIQDYWQRNKDKYHAVYTRDVCGEMRFAQVVLTSGLDDKKKTLRSTPGIHVIMPLFKKAAGRVIVGRDTMEGNPNQWLFDWEVWPIYLDADDHPGQTEVRLTSGSSRTNSVAIPMTLAINILLHGQIGAITFNSVVGIIESIIGIKTKLADELEAHKAKLSESRSMWAATQTKLDKTFEQLVDVVKVMGNKQRVGRSADAKELRIATTALLIELLPPDDSRRVFIEDIWNGFPDRTPRRKRVAAPA